MIFDTDVLIWALRGYENAADAIEGDEERMVSVITSMELYQGARNKKELSIIRQFLRQFGTLSLSENIGYRGSIYMEEYALKSGMGVADALIAASAVESQQTLFTGNIKHFRAISELHLKAFHPA